MLSCCQLEIVLVGIALNHLLAPVIKVTTKKPTFGQLRDQMKLHEIIEVVDVILMVRFPFICFYGRKFEPFR